MYSRFNGYGHQRLPPLHHQGSSNFPKCSMAAWNLLNFYGMRRPQYYSRLIPTFKTTYRKQCEDGIEATITRAHLEQGEIATIVNGFVSLESEVFRHPNGEANRFLFRVTLNDGQVRTIVLNGAGLVSLRRSCKPNCRLDQYILRHQNQPLFVAVATKFIQIEEELTIPFDYDWMHSHNGLRCAEHHHDISKCPMEQKRLYGLSLSEMRSVPPTIRQHEAPSPRSPSPSSLPEIQADQNNDQKEEEPSIQQQEPPDVPSISNDDEGELSDERESLQLQRIPENYYDSDVYYEVKNEYEDEQREGTNENECSRRSSDEDTMPKPIEPITTNVYSERVLELLKTLEPTEDRHNDEIVHVESLFRIAQVYSDTVIVANEYIFRDSFVIEITGRITGFGEIERQPGGCKGCFLYSLSEDSPGDDELICVEANNDAKFVGRACRPNSAIRHRFDSDGNFTLAIYSIHAITYGDPITIGFDRDYVETKNPLNCSINHTLFRDVCSAEFHRKNIENQLELAVQSSHCIFETRNQIQESTDTEISPETVHDANSRDESKVSCQEYSENLIQDQVNEGIRDNNSTNWDTQMHEESVNSHLAVDSWFVGSSGSSDESDDSDGNDTTFLRTETSANTKIAKGGFQFSEFDIQIIKFLAKEAKQSRTLIIMCYIWNKFREEVSSEKQVGWLKKRFREKIAPNVHKYNGFDLETRVQFFFYTATPVAKSLFNEFCKHASVKLNKRRKMYEYIANDGSLKLSTRECALPFSQESSLGSKRKRKRGDSGSHSYEKPGSNDWWDRPLTRSCTDQIFGRTDSEHIDERTYQGESNDSPSASNSISVDEMEHTSTKPIKKKKDRDITFKVDLGKSRYTSSKATNNAAATRLYFGSSSRAKLVRSAPTASTFSVRNVIRALKSFTAVVPNESSKLTDLNVRLRKIGDEVEDSEKIDEHLIYANMREVLEITLRKNRFENPKSDESMSMKEYLYGLKAMVLSLEFSDPKNDLLRRIRTRLEELEVSDERILLDKVLHCFEKLIFIF